MSEQYYIAICTLGENPNLNNCITKLLRIKDTSSHSIEVLVVVNSEIKKSNLPAEIKLHYEPLKGYSNVRNKAISVAPKDASIIFIDDDEIPTEKWLNALIIKHHQYPEDIIFGPVFPSPHSPHNAYRGKFNKYFEQLTDNSTVKQAGTGNMLIPHSLIKRKLINFDPEFNFLGSEDTDLCFRLRTLGVKIRYAKNAALTEVESVDRISSEYLWLRKYREVVTYSLVVRRNSGFRQRIWRFVTLGIRVLTFGVGALFSAKAQRTTWMYLKSLEALLFGRNI